MRSRCRRWRCVESQREEANVAPTEMEPRSASRPENVHGFSVFTADWCEFEGLECESSSSPEVNIYIHSASGAETRSWSQKKTAKK